MSNLEKLTNKIVEDAQVEADRIINEAQEEKNNMIAAMERKGEKEKTSILETAKREAELRRGRVVSNAKLKVRNDKLQAKRTVLEKAFSNAAEELNSISVNEKIEFIKNVLKNINVEGDENLILGADVKAEVSNNNRIDEINKVLQDRGMKGELKLSDSEKNIKGGFILEKNGIELNWSFESLINNLREDLEGELIGMLF